MGGGGGDGDMGGREAIIKGLEGLTIIGEGWLNIEICDGGMAGSDGGKEQPLAALATRIEVPMGPCQRGNPGNLGAGGVVVLGGGGGERKRSSDGIVAQINPNPLRSARIAVSKIGKGGVIHEEKQL